MRVILGCKHDTIAVLFGPQGTGKSTLAAIVALDREYFSDNIELGEKAKELVLSLAGKLIVEIGEMVARNSANANSIKSMVSRQVDVGRPAYGRAVEDRKRRNVFVGTCNDGEPLNDPTGNRRFLPVRVAEAIDLNWLRANVAQIVGKLRHWRQPAKISAFRATCGPLRQHTPTRHDCSQTSKSGLPSG